MLLWNDIKFMYMNIYRSDITSSPKQSIFASLMKMSLTECLTKATLCVIYIFRWLYVRNIYQFVSWRVKMAIFV